MTLLYASNTEKEIRERILLRFFILEQHYHLIKLIKKILSYTLSKFSLVAYEVCVYVFQNFFLFSEENTLV